MERTYYVYLLASRKHGTLYCGVTNEILRRVFEHKSRQVSGFTQKYGIDRLVWYECHGDIGVAIEREKLIKRWKRAWKINLIEENNPDWNDLYLELGGTFSSSVAPCLKISSPIDLLVIPAEWPAKAGRRAGTHKHRIHPKAGSADATALRDAPPSPSRGRRDGG